MSGNDVEADTSDMLQFLKSCMEFYAKVELPKEVKSESICKYCGKRREYMVKITKTGNGYNYMVSLAVCEDHLKIMKEIPGEVILNNQIFTKERLAEYLEYIENTDPSKIGPIKLSDLPQKKMEDFA